MDKDGVIKIDVVKVNRVFCFCESAGDDKALALESESLADGIRGAKKLQREVVTNDSGVREAAIREIFDKSAVF